MTDPLPPEPPANEQALPPDLSRQLEALGGQLVWRIGKDEVSEDVIVRLGFASATPRFAHLPRLRSAGDQELQAALEGGRVVIEWVD
ncbi:DUF3248 domain-containing protein [Deinococcus deserti]|uniref:DUF3248 domain-containing protein n=1 Tax=Deinococcus deserti (strain DSM 17065 / CIP 109153 / LMG 22923 / VCD115) TaxID=546414 RepID=C1CY21_DEIDV|nr:DUF3248 domain-containing protein [Deinococcus deserti]ACO46977.1 hypothetical protein Deide_19750 [Deinococcus deserti VCD115]